MSYECLAYLQLAEWSSGTGYIGGRIAAKTEGRQKKLTKFTNH